MDVLGRIKCTALATYRYECDSIHILSHTLYIVLEQLVVPTCYSEGCQQNSDNKSVIVIYSYSNIQSECFSGRDLNISGASACPPSRYVPVHAFFKVTQLNVALNSATWQVKREV